MHLPEFPIRWYMLIYQLNLINMKKIFTTLFLIGLFVNFTWAQKDLTILLVNDNDQTATNTDSLRHAITANGYNFTDYDATVNGIPGPDLLNAYELVIWSAGNDATTNFWDKSDSENIKANADLLSYLDNGGMLWLEGIDFMYDAFSGAKDTFPSGSFVYDYLGINIYAGQAHIDDKVVYDGLPMMVAVEGNGICTTDTVEWRWTTMWYADAMVPTETAVPVYQMGPSDYDLADYYCAIYNEKGDAKILSFFIRADGYKTATLGAQVAGEVLDYFNQFSTGTSVDVTSIEITSESGFEITENNGSLQLGITVLPENATNKTVTWSIAESSVNASITAGGLLTASGLDNGNGTATVIATANDGSGVTGEADITISNQTLGDGYKVLLVNDDARDYTKYYDIDTALTASEYTYKVYDAAKIGYVPDYDYLSNFNFVIWYCARDGVDVKFWDISDEENIACNTPLKEYADNGGVVWLQGRDVFYDVWGSKYTAKNAAGDSVIHNFESGDFVYDYMGISSYVAQTAVNETSGNYEGLEQIDLTEENEMNTLDPITWISATYPMYYAEVLDVTDNAVPLYYMGPETYDFSLYYSMLYNNNGNAHFVTSGFNPADIDTQDHLNQYIKEVLTYFESTVDIQTIEANDFELSIYPNPANQWLTITLNSSSQNSLNLQITDMAGKTVLNTVLESGINQKSIDISELSNGLYNVSIQSNLSISNQKLLIIK